MEFSEPTAGAPEEIQTPAPQIRSLVMTIEIIGFPTAFQADDERLIPFIRSAARTECQYLLYVRAVTSKIVRG